MEPTVEQPPWLWRAVAVMAVAGSIVVAAQRWGTDNAALTFPVAVLAGVPWLLAALGVRVPGLPWILVVLGATFVLVMDSAVNFNDLAPFQLVILTAGNAAVLRPRWSLAILAGSVAMLVVAEVAGRFGGAGIWGLGLTMGWFGGFSIRVQAQAHAAQGRRAAAEERHRIARELHDVVAHSLAVTMLNLTGARLALRRDPDEAEAALWQAEQSGRQSMADIRRAVGLLGATGIGPPVPDVTDIDDLVREFAAAGLRVTLSIEGDLQAVPTAIGLTLYRIVQESIANVVKHAPGVGAEVTLVVRPDSVRLSVRNPCAPVPSPTVDGGFGITGMSERATLVGGTLQVGPADGDWRVVAELPLGSP